LKAFLIKTTVYIFIVGLTFIITLSFADGKVDQFYLRFTSPAADNLIIGTSRSAQGILPSTINEELNRKFFNFSFTIAHSPYGPVYLNSIKKKLNPNTKDGIFIVCVDPWSISALKEYPNDSLKFGERSLCLATTKEVNQYPNFEYLYNNLGGKFYEIFFRFNNELYLHNDGWLEVTIPMDKKSVNDRINQKIKDYTNFNSAKFCYSDLRFLYLKKTINFLKNHGKVILVRLPLHQEIFKIEQEYMPSFNEKITELLPIVDSYYDMTNDNKNYIYTDGNHLYKESSKIASKKISDFILKLDSSQTIKAN